MKNDLLNKDSPECHTNEFCIATGLILRYEICLRGKLVAIK